MVSYFNLLRAKNKVTVPTFWSDQAIFLRHGFCVGFAMEFPFLYSNQYDTFVRKATLKGLERARYADYKMKERVRLDVIKTEKQ